MTIPWGCCVSGPLVCHNGGMQARREGAEWLTFGEAAEYAGVSLLELREALRGLTAPAQWGWRGGMAVQLVALEDLEGLYPVLRQRKRKAGPTLAERGIQLVNPEDVTTAARPSELRDKLTRAGRQLAAKESEVKQPKPSSAPQAAPEPQTPENLQEDSEVPLSHANRAALDPEMARLYQEMEAAATRNEELLRELSQAGQGLDALLESTAHPVSEGARAASPRPAPRKSRRTPTRLQVEERVVHPAEDALARSAEWNRLMREQQAIESRQKQVQWMSWGAAALLVVLFAFKGQDWLGGDPEATTPELPSVDPLRSARAPIADPPAPRTVELAPGDTPVELWNEDASEPSTSLSQGGSLVSFEEAVAAPNLVATQDWMPKENAPAQPSGAREAQADTREARPVEASAVRSDLGATDATASPSIASESDHAQAESIAGVPLSQGNAVEASAVNGNESGASSPKMLPYQSSDAVPCQYAALTGKGQPLRSVLGPCIGPWNESKELVAGTFRFAGYDLCRHHQTFQKELGGSVERASQVAKYAEQEGSLAPLVRLRVEHGASQLLQAQVGRWVESGFEAGLSKTHHVEPLPSTDHWRVHSWVRVQRPQRPSGPNSGDLPETELRHFRMDLHVDADRGRDRLLQLVWLPEAPQGKSAPETR